MGFWFAVFMLLESFRSIQCSKSVHIQHRHSILRVHSEVNLRAESSWPSILMSAALDCPNAVQFQPMETEPNDLDFVTFCNVRIYE